MKKPHTPTRVRITRTELATIRKRATSGPPRGDVSQVLAAYRQSRADVLRLCGALGEEQPDA